VRGHRAVIACAFSSMPGLKVRGDAGRAEPAAAGVSL